MRQFLLIHGGYHGAWCWKFVTSELNAQGHHAYVLDLPGHGSDQTDRRAINRRSYTDAIVRFIEEHQLHNVTLVGHSLAGTVLPEVWDKSSDRIDQIIFVAALVLNAGEAPIDLIPEERRPLYYDVASKRGDNSLILDESRARAMFLSDISSEKAADYYQLLTPQPFGVYLDRASHNPAISPSRIRYILCKKDGTLPPALCRSCADKVNASIEEIDSGHDVMLSQPKQLAALLVQPSGTS